MTAITASSRSATGRWCLQCRVQAPQPRQSARALADELQGFVTRNAPDFGALQLAAYVQQRIQAAPSGALPQSAIATPPIAKMRLDEFAPSALSVVVASPLLQPPRQPGADAGRPAHQGLHLWPSRRAALHFLWVGVVALVFALGWSTIATLVRMGRL